MFFFVKGLRRFINAGKHGQRKLKGMPNGSCRFQGKSWFHLHSNLLRSFVRTGFCPDSETITGDFRKDTHRFPTNDTESQLSKIRRSNRGYAPLSKALASRPSWSPIVGIAEKTRDVFCLSEAVVSVYTAKTNAFRMHSATCGESIVSRYISQIIVASSLRRHLSASISVFHRLKRFETFSYPHFKPSTALCAASQ